jgi:hypothetical protein
MVVAKKYEIVVPAQQLELAKKAVSDAKPKTAKPAKKSS